MGPRTSEEVQITYMHILFASFEAAPFFKTGGLGDVVGSLPIYLSKIGIKTSVCLPGYKSLQLPNPTIKLGSFRVIFNHKEEEVCLYTMEYTGNTSIYIIRHHFLEEFKHNSESIIEFIFFSKAVATMLSINRNFKYGKFDLVHLHDWHTASVAYFLGGMDKEFKLPTILTIHNLLYQGRIKKEELSTLVGSEINDPSYQSLLELGIKFSDFVTTVSPTYAKEIIKTRKGMNLRKLLFEKRDKTIGILNGIDNKIWNPHTDRSIVKNFNYKDFTMAKVANKLALQKELKLPVDPSYILVSFIGRLEPKQKGIDLICNSLSEIMAQENVQLVILGTGHISWARKIGKIVSKYPKKIVFINKFDEKLSHKLYACSDIMLIPSRFEPCGLVQMISMRYATLPLVRKTGGLADTVQDGVNGFVFEKYSPTEFTRTFRLALRLFKENPKKIAQMRLNVMKEDFSWDRSAREYKRLYLKVIKEHK